MNAAPSPHLKILTLFVALTAWSCGRKHVQQAAFPEATLCEGCAGLMVASSLDKEVAPRTFKEYYCLDGRLVYLRQDGEFPEPRPLEQVLFQSTVEPGVHQLEMGLLVGYDSPEWREPSLVIQHRTLEVEPGMITQVLVVVRPDPMPGGAAVVESVDGRSAPQKGTARLPLALGRPDPIRVAPPHIPAPPSDASRDSTLAWARTVGTELHAILDTLPSEVDHFHDQRPSLGAVSCVDDQLIVLRQLTATADRILAGMKESDTDTPSLAASRMDLGLLLDGFNSRLEALSTCGTALPEHPCRTSGMGGG